MYYTSHIMYIVPHKSFEAITQLYLSLVHTYSNSYIPLLTTSYIDAHPKVALVDGFYVHTITLV